MSSSGEIRELELGASIPRPDLHWEPSIYTMTQVLDKFSFPRVIRCDPSYFDLQTQKSTFDLQQPMMVYRSRKVTKLVANNATMDGEGKKYVMIGQTLLIPEDYKGWFAVLGRPDQLTAEINVTSYSTIQELVAHGTSKFLIAGQHTVYGLQMTDQKPEHRKVFPGDVFRVAGTYMAKTNYIKKGFLKNKACSIENKFLMCIDEGDREVLLPYDAKGQFYVISPVRENAAERIVQLHDVKEFPCVLKLVYGRIPSTPCYFTGTLIFTSRFKEHSVVASTVFNVRNVLLEIPVDTQLLYNVAKNEQSLLQNKGYKTAMSLCKERADIYMRQMKVALSILNNSEDDSDSLSVYSGPDIDPPSPPPSPPPLPPKLSRATPKTKISTKCVRDYEYPVLSKQVERRLSHQELLSQKVPLKSCSSVRLCFGNNAIRFPIKDGSVRFNTTDDVLSNEARSAPHRKYHSIHGVPRQIHSTHSSSDTLSSFEVYSIPPTPIRVPLTNEDDDCDSDLSTRDYENVTFFRDCCDIPPPLPCRPSRQHPGANDPLISDSFDDLPLGASAISLDNRSLCSVPDSGCGFETESVSVSGENNALCKMSVSDIVSAMRKLGIKEKSIDKFKADKIDGRLLESMNVDSLEECFPSFQKLEIRKISLFIEGMWTPKF